VTTEYFVDKEVSMKGSIYILERLNRLLEFIYYMFPFIDKD